MIKLSGVVQEIKNIYNAAWRNPLLGTHDFGGWLNFGFSARSDSRSQTV